MQIPEGWSISIAARNSGRIVNVEWASLPTVRDYLTVMRYARNSGGGNGWSVHGV